MATVIQIKRPATGGSVTAPTQTDIDTAELAYVFGTASQSNGGQRLYIGNEASNGVKVIGGEYFTEMLNHVAGTLTASSALIADTNSKLDNLKVDNLDLNGNSITSTDNNGDINITPQGSGNVVIDGLSHPTGDGSADQFLQTDGSGNLSFATVTSSFTLDADSGTNDVFSTGGTLTFEGGEGIDTTVSNDKINITAETATSANLGIAKFNTADFDVTAGDVTVKASGITDAQLAGGISNTKLSNYDVTIGSTTIALGGTDTDIAGVTSLVVDQLTVDGQDIATIASNQDITLTPHGTGSVKVPAGYKDRAGFVADSLASKAYVDAVKTGLTVKDSVRAATTGNITIATALNDGDTLDTNVTLADGDRVLVKNQTTGSQNGIYVVGSSPARATDMATSSVLEGGTFVFVEEGTANADNGYVVSTDGTITVGTTAHIWTQFSGAGQITAGDGLDKGTGATANTMEVNIDGVTTAIVSDAVVVRSSGTTGQVLRSDGNTNAAAWGQLDIANGSAITGTLPTANGGTGLTGYTAGDIIYASALNTLGKVAAGSAAEIMVMNSGATAPEWTNTIDCGSF
ncbi:MAG: hypothetical protein QGH83_09750 [Candidatus Pacebacteria bacterium]|nr:hypothetical protein [Candidatus Paceibacterota bacterium]